MNALIELVLNAGAPGYLLILLGATAALAAFGGCLHLALERGATVARIWLGVLLILVVGILLTSVGGWALGMSAMNAVLGQVDPEVRETIRIAGSAEAQSCFVLGFAAAWLPTFAAGAALGRAQLLGRGPSTAAGALFGLGLGLLLFGLGGWELSRIQGQQALVRADPAQRATIVSAMEHQANRRLLLGGVAGGVVLSAGLALLLLGTSRAALEEAKGDHP